MKKLTVITILSVILLLLSYATLFAQGTGSLVLPDCESPPVPTITIHQPDKVMPGLIFVTPFKPARDDHAYLMIMTHEGQIIRCKQFEPGDGGGDLKLLADGNLYYMDWRDWDYVRLDSNLEPLARYRAVTDLPNFTDNHDLQLVPPGSSLPEGSLLLGYYDNRISDTTAYGGHITATVQGFVLQAIDPITRGVVWQTDLWTVPLTEAVTPITGTIVDYIHINAWQVGPDDRLYLSARHTDSLFVIEPESGQLWRLGGPFSDFTIIGDERPFRHQHDVRVRQDEQGKLELTLFDNGNTAHLPPGSMVGPNYSSALAYQLDWERQVMTLTRQYTAGIFAPFMGSLQVLDNGNWLIGWGGANFSPAFPAAPALTEITPDGEKVLELWFDNPWISYRARKYAWWPHAIWLPVVVR